MFGEIKRFLTLPPTPSVGLVSPLHADVADRLATIRAQKTAAVTEVSRETINDIRFVTSWQREVMQLLAQPSSSLATAQDRSSTSKKKSAIVKALAGVKHLYSGGEDAMALVYTVTL